MSRARVTETQWIWSDQRMIKKKISYPPILYKLFESILVPEADRYGVKDIVVSIDDVVISVRTNYQGRRYVPKLKTSTFTSAIGFSTEFTITRANGTNITKQVFTKNMKKPTLETYDSDEYYTMVSFQPDLPIFGMQRLEDDIVALMKRRVVDLAGCSRNGVKVQLDTSVLPKTFPDYVGLYLQTSTARIYEKVNDRLEICVAIVNGEFEHFQQVSFVNNIATIKGGSHVCYITREITNYVTEIVDLLPSDIQNYLWVFVNAYIDSPAFDSQTKESLTTNVGIFKSTCPLREEFLNEIYCSLRDFHLFKSFDDVVKLGTSELQEANLAGTSQSEHCTLIITKGDCATAYAMSRLSDVGQDIYGVFPLRGKLLNVREASPEQFEKNSEMQNIKKMLGLQHGVSYNNVENLRYGHLMIMVDEEHDGFETKGLLINFLHYFWPSLLKVNNFLHVFIAPVVKAYHKKTNKEFLFYTMAEYDAWKKHAGNRYIIKYYKEVENIQSEEEVEESYFRGLDQQRIKNFLWVDKEDDEAIECAFSNMKIEELEAPEDGTDFHTKDKCIRYLDFVNEEFNPYALADLKRSIPSIMDGLQPCQRTILFYALRKPIIEKTGVDDFIDYVTEHSTYDQDEESLVGTIIGMAQNYVGSNNINLLQPNGKFGTRMMGGKDHVRSLFTQLSPITRYIFHMGDDLLLNYSNEDGQSNEPAWFIPIIPMVLVNGSEARGAAWSSFIPNYNPREIIANLKRLLEGKEVVPMLPCYKGFTGHIGKLASNDDTSYVTEGSYKLDDKKNVLTISELPVTSWTKNYKEFLDTASWCWKDIQAYRNYSDDTRVHFEIPMTEDQMNSATQEGLLNRFKLTTTLSTANMYLFNEKGELKKYDTPEQILKDFYRVRLEFYKKRKTPLLRKLKKDLLLLKNKVKFINEYWEGKIHRCAQLKEKGFQCLPSIEREVDKWLVEEGVAGEEKSQGNATEMKPGTEFDYLIDLPLLIITDKYVEELGREEKTKKNEIDFLLKSTDYKSLWLRDLDDLDKQLVDEFILVEKKPKRARDAAGGSANKKRRTK